MKTLTLEIDINDAQEEQLKRLVLITRDFHAIAPIHPAKRTCAQRITDLSTGIGQAVVAAIESDPALMLALGLPMSVDASKQPGLDGYVCRLNPPCIQCRDDHDYPTEPIGKCAAGLHDVYTTEGFCGGCHPERM